MLVVIIKLLLLSLLQYSDLVLLCFFPVQLGYTLDEIKNAVTKKTYASFEPMLDYCVVKIPRLPFDKFISAKRTLTTQMKATGEVMSICDNFEGALMKAIRSLEQHVDSLMSYDFSHLSREELMNALDVVDDQRIWKIAEAVRRGIPYTELQRLIFGLSIRLQTW